MPHIPLFSDGYPPWSAYCPHSKWHATFTCKKVSLQAYETQAPLVIYPLYFISTFAAKALLLSLYRPFFSPNFYLRTAVYIAFVLVVCQFVTGGFATVYSQCLPIPYFNNIKSRKTDCFNPGSSSIVSGTLDLVTDIILLCLPLPAVWNLNVTRRQKMIASSIVTLGALWVNSLNQIQFISLRKSQSNNCLRRPCWWHAKINVQGLQLGFHRQLYHFLK